MKKYILLFLLMITFFAVGCGNNEPSADDNAQNDESAVFAELEDLEFCFSSGAGGWGTTLQIDKDGNFWGLHTDYNLGETDAEYPKGTCHYCDFSGKFKDVTKVNEYTYSLKIEKLEFANELDTSEVKEGVLYEYTTPYGIRDTKEVLLYLPGAPIAELPEEYVDWIHTSLRNEKETELPFYGIYNPTEKTGFYSYKKIKK